MAVFELFGYVPSAIVFQNNGDFAFTPPTVNPLDGNTVDTTSHPGRAIFPPSANASFKTDQPILLYDLYYSGAGTLNLAMVASDDTTIIPITSVTGGPGSQTRLNQFIPAGAIVVITSTSGGANNRVELTGKQAKSDASV